MASDIKLGSINEKSYQDFTFPDDQLKQFNYFFGKNGSGKTALSKHIQKQNSTRCKVFDTDYVNQNVLYRESIEGSKLIIGKTNIHTEQTLNHSHKIIDNLTKSINEHETTRKRCSQDIYNLMQEKIDDGKKQFSVKRINQKQNAIKDPINAFNQWKADANKSTTSENYDSISDLKVKKSSLNQKKAQLKKIFLFDDDQERNRFIQMMKKVILKPDDEISKQVIDWLLDGEKIHELDKTDEEKKVQCQFCLNYFNPKKVKANINKRISTEYSNLIQMIAKIDERLRQSEKSLTDMKSWLNNDGVCENVQTSIEKLKEVIKAKKDETSKSIVVDSAIFNNIKDFNTYIDSRLNKIKSKISDIYNAEYNIEKVAKSFIGKNIINDLRINKKIDRLSEICKAKSDEEHSLTETKKYVQKVINESNDLSDFMKMFNDILNSLGVDFRLKFSEENNHEFGITLADTHSDIKIKSLSEGEIRLIGFIKFYLSFYEKYDKNSVKLNQENQVIILDDPITSVDVNNRYFMMTLIGDLIKDINKEKNESRIFVFTHSSIDFHSFFELKVDENDKQFFLIYKNIKNHSEVKKIDFKKISSFSDQYRISLVDVFKFCMEDLKSSYNGTGSYLRYANECRFVFETHARTNYNISKTTPSNIGSIMECYKINDSMRNALERMLGIINGLSHGISYNWDFYEQISEKEVQDAAKILIVILYKKDRNHVEAMLQNECDGPGNLKKRIKKWKARFTYTNK